MSLTLALTTAYGAVGALGVLAYLPQLRALLRDKGRSEHVPLTTWSLWGVQTTVVTTYAVVVNGDVAFIVVNLFSMIACNSCLAALLYNRYRKRLPTADNVVPLRPGPRQVA